MNHLATSGNPGISLLLQCKVLLTQILCFVVVEFGSPLLDMAVIRLLSLLLAGTLVCALSCTELSEAAAGMRIVLQASNKYQQNAKGSLKDC